MELPPIDLRIDREAAADGSVRLIVHGEIDIATVGQLRDALDAARAQHEAVCLDLLDVGFVDSSGLAVLIAAKRQAEQNSWRFELAPEVSPAVRRVFQLAGVEAFIWR